ncbi:hypothetical protein BH10BAC1_BH10BAC1_16650 [soil metagenome]
MVLSKIKRGEPFSNFSASNRNLYLKKIKAFEEGLS